MPNYFLITPEGKEGPYTDVELLDLLDRDLIDRQMQCQAEEDGTCLEVGDLFEVIIPEDAVGVRHVAADADAAEAPPPPEAEEVVLASTGEQVLYVSHTSMLLFWPYYTTAFVFFALGWLQRDVAHWPVILAGAVGIGILIASYILRLRHCFEITAKRVIRHDGIIMRSTREIRVDDIRTINVVRGGFRGLLGVGTVEFSSAGSSDGEVKFVNISRCHAVRHLVRQLQG